MVVDTLKKALSKIVPWRINRGIGLSVDDNVVLKNMPSQEQIESHISDSFRYNLRQGAGSFELVGIVKNGKTSQYQLRHLMSGDTFNISKQLLELLFEKTPRKPNK